MAERERGCHLSPSPTNASNHAEPIRRSPTSQPAPPPRTGDRRSTTATVVIAGDICSRSKIRRSGLTRPVAPPCRRHCTRRQIRWVLTQNQTADPALTSVDLVISQDAVSDLAKTHEVSPRKCPKGPYLNAARTHLQQALGDQNVLIVKFWDDAPTNARKIIENGLLVGLRRYRFFGCTSRA